MRRTLITLLGMAALGIPAQAGYKSQISQLHTGTLTGNVYTNDAVGVSFEVPGGWKAVADPSGSTSLDPEHPDSPMNLCAKYLLKLSAPGAVEGRFNSFGALIALDPACFSSPSFPQSPLNKDGINKVVDKMFKPFTKTSYCSPYGATVVARFFQGHIVISLNGTMTINALEGHPAKRKEPVDVKTSFSFTELNGYWVAWASVADEKSTGELNAAKLTFKDIPAMQH